MPSPRTPQRRRGYPRRRLGEWAITALMIVPSGLLLFFIILGLADYLRDRR